MAKVEFPEMGVLYQENGAWHLYLGIVERDDMQIFRASVARSEQEAVAELTNDGGTVLVAVAMVDILLLMAHKAPDEPAKIETGNPLLDAMRNVGGDHQ